MFTLLVPMVVIVSITAGVVCFPKGKRGLGKLGVFGVPALVVLTFVVFAIAIMSAIDAIFEGTDSGASDVMLGGIVAVGGVSVLTSTVAVLVGAIRPAHLHGRKIPAERP